MHNNNKKTQQKSQCFARNAKCKQTILIKYILAHVIRMCNSQINILTMNKWIYYTEGNNNNIKVKKKKEEIQTN